MNLHLHHATSFAAQAVTNISAISFFDKECNSEELRIQSLGYAREYLAKIVAELDAYEAQRAAEKK